MDNFINIIPIVEAQSTDAVAQPTFGSIQTSGGGVITSSILLSADKTSVNVGDLVKVKIAIKTNDLDISEYKLVVSYNPTMLTVVDDDATNSGTQVTLLDTLFQTTNPETDNIAANGLITLDAKTVSGNAFRVNRDVVQITFQALSAGSSSVKVEQGINGSHLIRLTGSELTFTGNEVTIQTSNQQSTNGNGNQNNQGNQGGQTGGGTTTTGGATHLPNTAVGDSTFWISSILGIFFILIGVSLSIRKEERRRKIKNR